MGLGTSKDKEWMKMHLALWKEIQEQSNFTLESVVKNNVMVISTQTFLERRFHFTNMT